MSYESKPQNGEYQGPLKVRVIPAGVSLRPDPDGGKFEDRGPTTPPKKPKALHCINGHAYTPENTRIRQSGKNERRACITCEKKRNKLRVRKR